MKVTTYPVPSLQRTDAIGACNISLFHVLLLLAAKVLIALEPT